LGGDAVQPNPEGDGYRGHRRHRQEERGDVGGGQHFPHLVFPGDF